MTSESSHPVSVAYFCSKPPTKGPAATIRAYISPSDNDWDDYGTQLRANLHVWTGSVFVSLPALIGFFGTDAKVRNGRIRLKEVVNSASRPISAKGYNYFLILPSMEHYRELVGSVGPRVSKSALLEARDLAAWYHYKPNALWLREAMRDDSFSISFMRDSEVHYALYNAGYIIRGLDQELTARPASSWQLTYSVAGSDNPHSFRLAFDHSDFLPRRISVIIGKNGVGKSQALHAIAKSLLSAANALVDSETGQRPQVSRLIAFSPSGEGSSSFPKESERHATWYRRYSLNRATHQARDRRPSEVILRLVRSSTSIARVSRLDLFRSAMQALNEHEQLALPVTSGAAVLFSDLSASTSINNLRRIARIDSSAAPVRFIDGDSLPLSSGELSFVMFAAQLCECIENGSLVLLDEPETHLHPNLISSFCALLERTLKFTGSSAIIATHSVYFVREVLREQVTVINRVGSVTEISKPRLRTFGADVGAISRFVFGEEDDSRLANQIKRSILSKESNWDKIYEKFKDELSLELLGAIRDELESDGAEE